MSQKFTDEDYADDLGHHSNKPALVKSLQHRVKYTARCSDLYLNTNERDIIKL